MQVKLENRKNLAKITSCYHCGLLVYLFHKSQRVDDGFKPSNDVGKKVNEVPRQEIKCKDQKEKDSVNITNRVNVVSSTVNVASNEVKAVGRKSSIEHPDYKNPNMLEFKDISIFEDSNKDIFGSKWVYKNKLDKRGIVIRNKERLVAQGHTQEEGINFDGVFALVARIEAIRLFLAYASFKDFEVYQMDVQSAFFMERLKKSQDKYVAEILKKFRFFEVKTASTPMETQKPLLKDEDG
nr:retrovirus-related Pol polyprotein from transposon TNT 1-94 [Tanacetum cinerariifolium]